jgi:hypothetical protein
MSRLTSAELDSYFSCPADDGNKSPGHPGTGASGRQGPAHPTSLLCAAEAGFADAGRLEGLRGLAERPGGAVLVRSCPD